MRKFRQWLRPPNTSTTLFQNRADARNVTRHYPTDVRVQAPEGGLTVNSVALCVQTRVISKSRLLNLRGALSDEIMFQIDNALRITLNL